MGDRWRRGLRIAVVVAVGIWVAGVVAATQVAGWLVAQTALVTGHPLPWWFWGAVGLAGGVPAGVAAVVLRALARRPAIRAAATAWAVAAVLLIILAPLRALPLSRPEFGAAATAAVCWLAALAGHARRRSVEPASAVLRPRALLAEPGALPLSTVAGLVLLLPWLAVGALGGVLVTVTGALAAAGLGALAGSVLSGRFWSAYGSDPRRREVLGGGAAAGVSLVVLCAGLGQGGAQLALLATVPMLGFAVARLYRWGTAGRTAGVAVGLAAAGPLMFVAPVQLSLLLGRRDVAFYAAVASLVGLAAAVVLSAGYTVALRRTEARPRAGAGVLVLVLLAGAACYLGLGHPGLHGDRLLVVLRRQADLSGVAAIGDPVRRRSTVYHRLVTTARDAQHDLRATLTRYHLGYTPYYLVDAIEVDAGGPAVRHWLAARPDVDRVLSERRLRPISRKPTPMHGTKDRPESPQWNIRAIGADRVVRRLHVDGSGIVVGSSDSGVDGTHPALRGGFRGGDDSWYDPWYGSATPTDYQGHGTHTLGSAVGTGGIGVAPGAQWVGCVDLARNLGNPARYLDCLQFMFAPFPRGGDPFSDGNPARAPQVLTNSWSCPALEGCDAGALAGAVRALTAAGSYVVAAAGNGGPRCGSAGDPLGRYRRVLSVGATDRAGALADFSGRGRRKPDLVAPGVDVVSALPGGDYGMLSGTSMATPQVAGVVALMWSANPDLVGDIAETTRILTSTARPLPHSAAACGGHRPAGAGLVDAYAAVTAAEHAD